MTELLNGSPVIRSSEEPPGGGAWYDPKALALILEVSLRTVQARWAREGRPTIRDPQGVKLRGSSQARLYWYDGQEWSEAPAPISTAKPPPDGAEGIEITPQDDGLTVVGKWRDIRTLEQLLAEAQVDTDVWETVSWKANTWEGFIKNAAKKAEKVRLFQVTAKLARKASSRVSPVTVVLPRRINTYVQSRHGMLRAVVFPDTQHGHRRDARTGLLHPMHDRRAIDVAMQIAHAVQPDLLVWLGDGVDFAELSEKYPTPPELRGTTQAAIDEVGYEIGRSRVAVGSSCQIVFIDGNHEDRLSRLQVSKAPGLVGLRAVGDERDALDLARLLDFDSAGVEHVTPYGEDWWWQDRIRFIHDAGVKSGGGRTASSAVADAEYTTLFGHIHRLEMACKTMYGPRGARTISAASPGCLCRTDAEGPPGVKRKQDWQQGVAVITLLPDGTDHVSLVEIKGGKALWDSKIFVGQDRTEEIARTINHPLAQG